jgi:hypothetical protein
VFSGGLDGPGNIASVVGGPPGGGLSKKFVLSVCPGRSDDPEAIVSFAGVLLRPAVLGTPPGGGLSKKFVFSVFSGSPGGLESIVSVRGALLRGWLSKKFVF